jgi:hypothetical protein
MELDVDAVTGETLFETRTDRPNVEPKVKMIYRGMLYHDLRRSCVRNLVRAGVPEKTAMKISGHLNRQVFDRYNISSDKDVLDAGQKLAAYLDQDLSENGDKTGTMVHQNAAATSSVQ